MERPSGLSTEKPRFSCTWKPRFLVNYKHGRGVGHIIRQDQHQGKGGLMITVTVYSKPRCVQCTATYRALDNAGVSYEVVDVTENAAAYEYVTGDLGYSQAPIVVVDEEDHWSGFQPDQIARVAAAFAAKA